MRRNGRSKVMWGTTIAALLWFVEPIGAIPLESWDDKIPNAGTRFKVLTEFGGQAVLDKETGLVWEQSPATTTYEWHDARVQCANRTTGGRKGWRLPSVHELNSLIDPTLGPPGPALSVGHPFLNVQTNIYWSATTVAGFPDVAWWINTFVGEVFAEHKAFRHYAWCVRGGANADQY